MSQVTINSAKHIICKTLKRKYTKCNKQQWLPFCHSTEVESGELERSPLCFFLYPGGTISKSTSAKNSLLHVPLTAPPLCAGTGYSLRFFSVEQSLIFLNTQDMCLQCLTGSRILSTEQGSRNVDTQSNHPSTYVDPRNSTFKSKSHLYFKNSYHQSIIGVQLKASPLNYEIIDSSHRWVIDEKKMASKGLKPDFLCQIHV